MTNNLTWNKHIVEVTLKGNNKHGLIRRLCKDIVDTHTRKLLHCSIVRLQLEYGSEVWSPYTIKLKMQIENVQRRATKFILGYPRDTDYKQRLIRLLMLPLVYRREMADLVLLFKSKIGSSDINHSRFLQPSSQNQRYKTRNSSSYNYEIKFAKQDYLRWLHTVSWKAENTCFRPKISCIDILLGEWT